MSLMGRYLIDRMKRALPGFRLPVPPYHQPSYWDGVYRQLGPQDSFEWGRISSSDLMEYTYTHYKVKETSSSNSSSPESLLLSNLLDSSRKSTAAASQPVITTLGETLNVYPHAPSDEPILMLGCGNSDFGPDMIRHGNWRGPVIMVDVSARVVESMSLRHDDLQQSGDLQFVQDDATVLSAFSNEQVCAVLDKGLVDAIFCADDYDSCWNILTSVHRVLQPGGYYVCLSFSRPEFLLNRMLLPSPNNKSIAGLSNATMLDTQKRLQWFQKAWDHVEVRQLDRILVYRFQKAKQDIKLARKARY